MPTLFMMQDLGNPNYWPKEFVDDVPLRPRFPLSPEVRKMLQESNIRFRAKDLGIPAWHTENIEKLQRLMPDRERRLAHTNTAKFIEVHNPEDFGLQALHEAYCFYFRSRHRDVMFCELPGEPLLSMYQVCKASEERERRQGKNHNNDEGGYHIEIILPSP